MDRKWSTTIISLAFLFISSCYAVSRIQQVTEGKVLEITGSDDLEANLGVTRELRDERPASKIVTIPGYSLIQYMDAPYESSVFEAAGYKWRLVLYFKGKHSDGMTGNISLYVRIEETASLPKGWEVDVDLKLFVYNGKQAKYLTVTDGTVKTFNDANKELGYGQLIPLSTFKNASEGYLVEDTATFGAEIFIWTPTKVQERVRIISNPPDNVFTWKILRLSTLENEIFGDEFLVGDRYWRVGFNPKARKSTEVVVYCYGRGYKKDALVTGTFANFIWRIKNQRTSNHIQKSLSHIYPGYANTYGMGGGAPISELNGTRGYLENDSIIVEIELAKVSVTDIVPA